MFVRLTRVEFAARLVLNNQSSRYYCCLSWNLNCITAYLKVEMMMSNTLNAMFCGCDQQHCWPQSLLCQFLLACCHYHFQFGNTSGCNMICIRMYACKDYCTYTFSLLLALHSYKVWLPLAYPQVLLPKQFEIMLIY